MTPWWKGAAIYQIYPLSFLDANADGFGDLKGVLRGLDYVAALGVDGFWLSPFFTSPMADCGYDVADHRNVDPIFGALDDFDAVVARAHELGLKIMIDQVYSHTSDQHAWFRESRRSQGNDKADWYVWADPKPDGSPPNNWISVFGGPAWTWDETRSQYYLHNFLAQQPDLNFHEPSVQEALLDTARFWLERGVDGLRLDVVNYYTHDPALRDNPPAPAPTAKRQDFFTQRHLYSCSRPENFSFIARLRALADQYGDVCLLGEIFDDDPLDRQLDYVRGDDRLHTAYSFHLLQAEKATPALFADALTAWEKTESWPSWALGNHDVMRFSTRFFGGSPTPRRTRLALALLLSLRGTAFLYQGDELGLPQARVPSGRMRDPHSRRNLQGSGRDGARTPFPWRADAPNAGFSGAAKTWLPLDERHRPLAAERQADDPASVLCFTLRFLTMRKKHACLLNGDVKSVEAGDGVLTFERVGADGAVFCAFNFTDEEKSRAAPANGTLLNSGLNASLSQGALSLPPFGGALVAHA